MTTTATTVALNRLITGSLSLAASAFLAYKTIFVVPGGHHGLVFSQGEGVKLNKVYTEGLGWVIPFWQSPVVLSTRIRPSTLKTKTGSKDLQTIDIACRVLFQPSIAQLPRLYQEYGSNYAETILPGIGNEVMKSVVARYNAIELITLRDTISHEIANKLKDEAGRYNLKLVDVAITELSFSKEFTSAIERKQVAQQDAQKAKFEVEKAKQEQLATIVKAEGESKAAELITQATSLAGPGYVELRRLDASKEIAEKLSRNPKITYVPTGGDDSNSLLLSVPLEK